MVKNIETETSSKVVRFPIERTVDPIKWESWQYIERMMAVPEDQAELNRLLREASRRPAAINRPHLRIVR